jgi:hypothetical protein
MTVSRDLDAAEACLAGEAFALAEDPLELRLPPLDAHSALLDSATLRAVAALYLHGELEQAGVVPVAEMLAEARAQLALRGSGAARKLEDFARDMRSQYDLASRNRIFARLFGTGRAVLNGEGTPVNREFESLLAGLCLALRQVEIDYRFANVPAPARDVRLQQAASRLLGNLAMRPFGNAIVAGRRMQAQLRRALELLGDPEVWALVGGRGTWDTLAKLLGAEMPDVGRFVDRGRNGLRLLEWLAQVLPHLRTQALSPPLAPVGSPAFAWADVWLRASGIEG